MRKLDVIGTGPGASDLLTLRAVNRIKEADSIFVPVNKGKNLALDTVKEFIERKNIIELDFPMKKVTKSHYEKAAKIIDENLINRGVYLTIGDAMTYATSLYIADELAKLKTDIVLENVPGITSYLAAFNRVNLPLTLKGEKFLLIDDIENTPEKLLNEVDSIAVLKTYKNPEKIKEKLESYGFNPRYIQRLSMKEERVFEIDEEISGEKDYISLMVARKDR